MPEALARMRHDSILSVPNRGNNSDASRTVFRRFVWRVPRRAGSYAGAAFAAAVVGILINALALQHERHPSPFFASAQTPHVSDPQPIPQKGNETSSSPVVMPPTRPTNLSAATETAGTRVGDPIGEVLRGAPAKEGQKLVSSAQIALGKLGYVVKVTGIAGPETLVAIRDFQKSHGLTVSTEITPRFVKQLSSAANSAALR